MRKIGKTVQKHRELALISIDIVFVCIATLLAYLIRIEFGTFYSLETFKSVLLNLPFVILINMICLLLFKVNRTLWQYVSIDEVIRLVASVFLANFTWFILLMVLNIKSYPKSVPAIACMVQILLMLGLRVIYRLYRRKVMQSTRKYKALIVGAGTAGAIALKNITFTDQYDSRVVGFIDDNSLKKGKIISGVEVLGTTDEIKDIVSKYSVDIVYIAIKNISKTEMKNILDKCRNVNVKTKIISFEVLDGNELSTKIRDVSIEDLLGRGEIKLDNSGISNYITNKVIMVTGAGGSIGSELCRQIIKFHPKEIVMFDFYENNMYDLQQEIKIAQMHGQMDNSVLISCYIGSVREKNRVDAIVRKHNPSTVFHAAAHKHVPLVEDSPAEAIKNNVFGTYNVICSCIENKVDRFVLISTDKAVNPTNVMGATKRMCELLVQGLKDNGTTKLCAVRFGNVLGSNGSVIPLFKRQIESGGPITVTDPNIIRYFMTIPEASQLVLQAGMYSNSGEIFVLDMGTPVKILDLAENLIRLSGFTPYEDIDIIFTGLRPGEKMFEELILDNETHEKTENDLIFISKPIEINESQINEKIQLLKSSINNPDIKTAIMNVIA